MNCLKITFGQTRISRVHSTKLPQKVSFTSNSLLHQKVFPNINSQNLLYSTTKRPTGKYADRYNRRVIRRVIRNPQPLAKVQKKSKKWSKLLRSTGSPQNIIPKTIQPPPSIKPLIQPGAAPAQKKARRKFRQWLSENAGIIVLNFGSIASFLSFTRTDILELRLFSITGSLSSVVYFLSRPPPLVLGPILWSSVFASTNAYMVYHIYQERKGKPRQLTLEEENVYEEHFLPYALTPRQFEKLLNISKKRELERGEVLIQKGQQINKVYLTISGSVDAVTTMSRRVTAASSSKGNKDKLVGGDAGAWIGELAFLDYLANIDKQGGVLNTPPPSLSSLTEDATKDKPLATAATVEQGSKTKNEGKAVDLKPHDFLPKTSVTQNSILTYIATERSTMYEWDFDALADLMKTSSDFRSALTRSMTAAVVGKVVNMYISKVDADLPVWKKWLAGQSASDEHLENISAVKVHVSQE